MWHLSRRLTRRDANELIDSVSASDIVVWVMAPSSPISAITAVDRLSADTTVEDDTTAC